MTAPRTRQTSTTHPGYRLTPEDRHDLGVLATLRLWTDTELARTFGVSRKTVADCRRRHQLEAGP